MGISHTTSGAMNWRFTTAAFYEGIRVFSKTLQDTVLEELHDGHLGVVKMKALARSYVWWPDISGRVEELAKCCNRCQLNQRMPTKAPLHPWEWATAPWQRLQMDYAGPFQNSMFLVVTLSTHTAGGQKWFPWVPTLQVRLSKSYVIYSPDSEFLNRLSAITIHNLLLRSSRLSSSQMASAISHQHHIIRLLTVDWLRG